MGGEEQVNPAQQHHVLIPVGDFDHGQPAAGELGGDALDQFLVRMVRAGEIERRFPKLDFQRVEEAQEHPRQGQGQHLVLAAAPIGDIAHIEAARHHVHAHRRQHHHRLVGHHLQQLALRPNEAVGRAGFVSAQHEEDRSQRQREDHQQQVEPGKEERAGEDHHQQKEKDVKVLGAPHHDGLLVPELDDIEEGLPDGRPLPRLHARRENAIGSDQQTAQQGRDENKGKSLNPGFHAR